MIVTREATETGFVAFQNSTNTRSLPAVRSRHMGVERDVLQQSVAIVHLDGQMELESKSQFKFEN